MNLIQVLILIACVAVLLVNFLTWRACRKTAEMLKQARVNIVSTFASGK